MLGAAGGGGGGRRRRVGSWVDGSRAAGGQLGLRLGGGAVRLLPVLGQEPPAALLLLGQTGVRGGSVGVWEDAGPLQVARVALVAARPGGQRPGRAKQSTLGE